MATSTNGYSYKEHVRIGYYHQSYGWISPPVATASDIENIQQEINQFFDVTNPLEKNTIKINKIEKKDCCTEDCDGCDPEDPSTCCCIDMGSTCLEWNDPEDDNDENDDDQPDDPEKPIKKKTRIDKEKVQAPAVETDEITTETIEALNPVFDSPNASCTKTKCQQNKETIQTDTLNVGTPANTAGSGAPVSAGGAGGVGAGAIGGGAGAMVPSTFVGPSSPATGANASGVVVDGDIATTGQILTDIIKSNMPDVGTTIEDVLIKAGTVFTSSVQPPPDAPEARVLLGNGITVGGVMIQDEAIDACAIYCHTIGQNPDCGEGIIIDGITINSGSITNIQNLTLANLTTSTSKEFLVVEDNTVKKRSLGDIEYDPINSFRFFDDFCGVRAFPATNVSGGQLAQIISSNVFQIFGDLTNISVSNTISNTMSINYIPHAFEQTFALWANTRNIVAGSGLLTYEIRLSMSSSFNTNVMYMFFGLGQEGSGFVGRDLADMPNHVGFLFDSTDGDFLYRLVSRDGDAMTSSQNVSATSLTTNFTCFRIELDDTSLNPEARFYVNNVLIATKTTDIPSMLAPLCPYISSFQAIAQPAFSVNIDYISVKQTLNRKSS